MKTVGMILNHNKNADLDINEKNCLLLSIDIDSYLSINCFSDALGYSGTRIKNKVHQ
ncbi:hypothetical protein AP058_01111 [Flavobacterium sp. TAB 87]|nr:hypothetical protein AP058_01111 [Flavobacterium sp. TAB 87]